MRVVQMRLEADQVVSLELDATDGAPLERWEPGAHIDIVLKSGLVRQYSLCGAQDNPHVYRIAVLRDSGSRGGSQEVHDVLRVGDRVEVRGPRNHFALVAADRYVFVAGGIGITPMLPMIEHAAAARKAWQLFYLGRTASSMSFRSQLAAYGDRVHVLPDDASHGVSLDSIIETAKGAELYCCGPTGLINAIETRCASAGIAEHCHVERFTPAELPNDPSGNVPFTAVIASTEEEVQVPANRTLLQCLLDHGADVVFSCEEGMCGSCEVGVLEGTPLHRDSVMNDREKVKGDRMMVCVSRAKSSRIVLKL